MALKFSKGTITNPSSEEDDNGISCKEERQEGHHQSTLYA